MAMLALSLLSTLLQGLQLSSVLSQPQWPGRFLICYDSSSRRSLGYDLSDRQYSAGARRACVATARRSSDGKWAGFSTGVTTAWKPSISKSCSSDAIRVMCWTHECNLRWSTIRDVVEECYSNSTKLRTAESEELIYPHYERSLSCWDSALGFSRTITNLDPRRAEICTAEAHLDGGAWVFNGTGPLTIWRSHLHATNRCRPSQMRAACTVNDCNDAWTSFEALQKNCDGNQAHCQDCAAEVLDELEEDEPAALLFESLNLPELHLNGSDWVWAEYQPEASVDSRGAPPASLLRTSRRGGIVVSSAQQPPRITLSFITQRDKSRSNRPQENTRIGSNAPPEARGNRPPDHTGLGSDPSPKAMGRGAGVLDENDVLYQQEHHRGEGSGGERGAGQGRSNGTYPGTADRDSATGFTDGHVVDAGALGSSSGGGPVHGSIQGVPSDSRHPAHPKSIIRFDAVLSSARDAAIPSKKPLTLSALGPWATTSQPDSVNLVPDDVFNSDGGSSDPEGKHHEKRVWYSPRRVSPPPSVDRKAIDEEGSELGIEILRFGVFGCLAVAGIIILAFIALLIVLRQRPIDVCPETKEPLTGPAQAGARLVHGTSLQYIDMGRI